MSKDESDFKQKVKLLLIDKVLLGSFVAILAFFIQSHLDNRSAALEAQQAERDRVAVEQQHIRDITLAVSRVATEVVDTDRRTVITSVRDLLAVLNEHEIDGGVTKAEDRARLREIAEKIENSLNQLTELNPGLADTSEPFVRLVRRIRSDLVNNKRRGPDDLREDARILLESYTEFLAELRETSVMALEADRTAVIDILSRGRPERD